MDEFLIEMYRVIFGILLYMIFIKPAVEGIGTWGGKVIAYLHAIMELLDEIADLLCDDGDDDDDKEEVPVAENVEVVGKTLPFKARGRRKAA